MATKIKIFYPDVQHLIGDKDSIMVEGHTVGECLQSLVRKYPEVEKLIFNKQGELLKRVFVYVNIESLYKADLSRPVSDKDEIILTVMIIGG